MSDVQKKDSKGKRKHNGQENKDKHQKAKQFSKGDAQGKNKRKQVGDSEEKKKWQPKSILQEAGDGPANKKRALRRQRNSQKPNFEAVCQSKLLWNELREKKCSEERRTLLVKELHDALLGKYKEVALKHDASRLVQAVIQYGSEEQRIIILDEIGKGSGFVELCRSTYAHYVVIKLVEHIRSKEGLRKLTDALKGNVCALATHSVAARVIELALMNFKTPQAATLRLELYGREFAVFVDEILKEIVNYNKTLIPGNKDNNNEKSIPVSMKPSLSTLLTLRPTRSEQILSHVSGVIGKLMLKGLLPFQYAHELLCEYMECCSDAQFQEVLPSVIDNSLVLLSTRPGTKVVCLAAIKGGAKERRRLLKLVKGHTAALLAHRDAYMAVLVLCEFTDDTVALQNSLLAELCVVPTEADIANNQQYSANPFLDEDVEGDNDEDVADEEENDDEEEDDDDDDDDDDVAVEDSTQTQKKGKKVETLEGDLSAFSPLLTVCLGANSCKLILRLASGNAANCFLDPYELSLLNMVSETSKKDAQLRRDELISFLEEPLNEIILNHSNLLLTSSSSRGAGSGAFLTSFFTNISISKNGTAANAIVSLLTKNNEEEEDSLLDHVIAHSVLKNIIKAETSKLISKKDEGDQEEEKDVSVVTPLSSALFDLFLSDPSLLNVITHSNRAAFVISALLDIKSKASSELCNQLLPLRSEISTAATTSKGANLILTVLNETHPPMVSSKPTKKTPAKSKPASNDSTSAKTPKAVSKKALTTSQSEMKPSRKTPTVKKQSAPLTEKKASPAASRTRSAMKKKAAAALK